MYEYKYIAPHRSKFIEYYDDLSEKEKAQWDEVEWDEDGGVPDRVNAEAVNRQFFNEHSVDMRMKTRGRLKL